MINLLKRVKIIFKKCDEKTGRILNWNTAVNKLFFITFNFNIYYIVGNIIII